ncbi:hypothetical protein KKC97_02450, partial [bacterium]|nr:hypothetical protein [bacterium]
FILADCQVTFSADNIDWLTIKQVYINTLQVLNLGKPEDSNLLTGSIWIELLKLFQRAFSVTMIAMFIFAIRRRFKH